MPPIVACVRAASRPLSRLGTALAAAGALSLAGQARAEAPADPTPPSAIATAPEPAPAPSAGTATLTGNWGGLRDRLVDAGLTLLGSYSGNFAANLSGGDRRSMTEAGQFALGAKLDTEKAFGWAGGSVVGTISYRRGKELAQLAGLNTLLGPQEIYGRGQTWRLTELYYRQRIGALDLALGRLTMGADFASQPCDFENLGFCGNQQGNLVGDYWLNYPVSQWGARAKISHHNWYVMVGLYESNPNNLRNGIALSHGGAKGVTAPVELGWTPRLGAKGLPGLYRIGGWYNNTRAADVLDGADGRPFGLTGQAAAMRTGRYGGYILLRQQLTGRYRIDPVDGPQTTSGLTLVVNITETDRATSRVDNQIEAWLTWKAPFAGRPLDEAGLAIGRNAMNGRATYATLLATPGTEKPKAEYPIELFYAVHPKPWFRLSPDFQYIIDPGGYRRARNVTVLGFRTDVTF